MEWFIYIDDIIICLNTNKSFPFFYYMFFHAEIHCNSIVEILYRRIETSHTIRDGNLSAVKTDIHSIG